MTVVNKLLLALLQGAAFVGCAEQSFVLARRDGPPVCNIAIAPDADATVRYAACELRDFTKRMTGVELAVVTNASQAGRSVVLRVDPGLAKGRCSDAFQLRTEGERLFIVGGGSRGALYGVYELLERFGGCEWFAPWCEDIPDVEVFEVPGDLNVLESPAFEQRETSWRHVITGKNRFAVKQGHPAFGARMRFNGQWHKESLYGGTAMPFPKRLGICHTFNELVPPGKHFASHPEWFSEIDGQRVGERAQLCWSNAELVDFVAEEVKRRLRSEPDSCIVGVSQNDWRNWCRCAKCAELTEREGSPAGPNIKFVNAVAEKVEKEFPHVLVETLAYMFTRRPPKTIRPRRNVAVCLCSFECSFSVPFAESKHENTVRFVNDVRGWGGICRNLFIYNYTVNFRNYLFPFPNIYTMKPNYRMFLESGARWIYDQADSNGHHAEFAELKCYLQSKLMWNPDRDVDALIDRFMKGYYGAAAPKVRQYFNELYGAFDIKNEHNPDPDAEPSSAGIYGENLPQLTDAKLVRWERLWRESEMAVKDDPVRLYNVRMSALPVMYVRLKRLYERGWKTVWITDNLAPHIARMEAMKPVAAEFVSRMDEARTAKRTISLSEDYRVRHTTMLGHFRSAADWKPPAEGSKCVEIPAAELEYIPIDRAWQIPIRLLATDEDAEYRVRVRLRKKSNVERSLGRIADKYGFAAGLRVRWLPKAQGRMRVETPRDRLREEWGWYDIGAFDFSSLQRIPLPTMDGLCLFVQGDVELDRVEISRP